MSEFAPKHEGGKEVELSKHELDQLSKKNYERLRHEAEKAESRKDSIEAIQDRIERAARSSQETLEASTLETAEHESELLKASSQLKSHSLNQTVKRIQKQLPASDRAFSKVIHQPVVEAVSNATESTIARPSGLLAGGLCSVVSSLVVLYICRHYGYEYNFLIGIAAFVGGFFLGVIIEGLGKIFDRN